MSDIYDGIDLSKSPQEIIWEMDRRRFQKEMDERKEAEKWAEENPGLHVIFTLSVIAGLFFAACGSWMLFVLVLRWLDFLARVVWP